MTESVRRIFVVAPPGQSADGREAALVRSKRVALHRIASVGEAVSALEKGDRVSALIVDDPGHDPFLEAILGGIRQHFPTVAILSRDGAFGPDDGREEHQELELEHACLLQEMLGSNAALRLAGAVGDTPDVGRSYAELLDALTRGADVAEVAAVVERDPTTSLKVLQLVNSAFFGLNRRITSVLHAVELLGPEILKGVVITAQTFSTFEATSSRGFSVEQFQSYSSRVARLARRLGTPHGLGDDAFSAGLLLDVGKLVIATRNPLASETVLQRSFESGEAAHQIERDLLGTTHAEVGARVLSLQGIPSPIVECVAFHHEPRRGLIPRKLTAIVHAADALLGIASCGDPESALDRSFVRDAGLAGELEGWAAEAAREAHEPQAA